MLVFQQEREGVRKMGQESRSIARASAAEAGVTGKSVDALLGSLQADESAAVANIDRTQVVTIDQLQRMKLGADATAQSRINSTPRASFIGTGLRIGSAGLDTYTQLRARRGG